MPRGTRSSPWRVRIWRTIRCSTTRGCRATGSSRVPRATYRRWRSRMAAPAQSAPPESDTPAARCPSSNVAYRDALTWANPALRSLEEQVLVPMFGRDPVELGLRGHEPRVYAALAASPGYQRLFAAAFPSAAPADGHPAGVERLVTTENIALALAAFSNLWPSAPEADGLRRLTPARRFGSCPPFCDPEGPAGTYKKANKCGDLWNFGFAVDGLKVRDRHREEQPETATPCPPTATAPVSLWCQECGVRARRRSASSVQWVLTFLLTNFWCSRWVF